MAEDDLSDMPFIKLARTRWLSRGKVITRIYTNWYVLSEYFSTVVSEPQGINGPQRYKAREILNVLNDDVNHLYLTFALPIVTEFERVNAFFQSDKADPNASIVELDLHYRSLNARVYDTRGNQKALSLVDFRAKFLSECQDFTKRHTVEELQNVKLRCLDMLKECI